MRAVIQRVTQARVEVDGTIVGAIHAGLCVLIGVAVGDTRDDAQWMANRLAKLRVFIDDTGRMNRALLDLPDHDLLIISQFTLCADTSGHRPGFSPAAAPDVAAPLIDQVVAICQTALARPVATGRFGADMQVHLINDGPVTITLDSRVQD